MPFCSIQPPRCRHIVQQRRRPRTLRDEHFARSDVGVMAALASRDDASGWDTRVKSPTFTYTYAAYVEKLPVSMHGLGCAQHGYECPSSSSQAAYKCPTPYPSMAYKCTSSPRGCQAVTRD